MTTVHYFITQQLNNDGDSAGDLCDRDDDNDGVGMFSYA